MPEDKREKEQFPVGDNSDPTGIGPPPPGAETSVKDGQGMTKAPELKETGKDDDQTGA